MEYSTLTNQNQITIPMKIRDKLKLKPSDKIVFIQYGDTITVSKLKSISDFKGLIKDSKLKLNKKDKEEVWLERYKRYESKKEK